MNSKNETPVQTDPRKRGMTLLRMVLCLAAAGAVFWLGHYAVHAYHYAETDDAYTAGHLHMVSAQIGGQVAAVLVDDNQPVKEGDTLARVDPLAFRLAVEKAAAAVAQAKAQHAQAQSSEKLAEAQLAEAQAKESQAEALCRVSLTQTDLAETNYKRTQQLFIRGGASTQADVDNDRSAWEAGKASLEAAKASLAAAHSGVLSARASIRSAREQSNVAASAVSAAEAVLHDAERQLSYTTITAPSAGLVGNKKIEVGNTIQAGQTLFALAEPQVWVVANFKETQIGHMKPGQEVEITVDAIPGEPLHGRVDSLAPASGAQFALLPPDNATGNFNKVVQRVPVKIVFDQDSLQRMAGRLRLGLSVIVDVRVR